MMTNCHFIDGHKESADRFFRPGGCDNAAYGDFFKYHAKYAGITGIDDEQYWQAVISTDFIRQDGAELYEKYKDLPYTVDFINAIWTALDDCR